MAIQKAVPRQGTSQHNIIFRVIRHNTRNLAWLEKFDKGRIVLT